MPLLPFDQQQQAAKRCNDASARCSPLAMGSKRREAWTRAVSCREASGSDDSVRAQRGTRKKADEKRSKFYSHSVLPEVLVLEDLAAHPIIVVVQQ